jgi:hypothetical protein
MNHDPRAPYDVVVCGGGTAGAVAAIKAGRLGARTLVIERLGSLGGTQTNGWVTPMMPNYLGEHKLSRGISIEATERQNAFQPAGPDVPHGDVWFDPVYLGLVLDRLATEAGVTCLFDATVTGARREGPRLTAVEVAARGGRRRIEGRTFVDATGDAELSALAGAELMGGNEEGVHQPMTLRFFMGGIDLERLRDGLPVWRMQGQGYLETGWGEAKDANIVGAMVREAIAQGVLEEDDLGYFQMFTMNGRPGELAFNSPRVAGLDPTDPFQLSRAYQVGREKIYRIAEFVRRWFPGCGNAYVSGIAPLIGIRESRRVVGEYVLTAEDHQSCRKFDDTIARNRYPVDIHLKTGLDFRPFPPGEYHDVPYRSLVVKGFDNLWVAGRCLSADFVAQSSVRIQPVCRAMGEAAGAAAALCAQGDLAAHDLPYQALRPHLDLSLPPDQA